MKISVAMAACNGHKYITGQINSIASQTLPPHEIWVCDDRSIDDTPQILNSFASAGILNYAINDNRLGVTENFKQVVAKVAKDSWVSLSDQDDIWVPEKLRICADELSRFNDNNIPCLVYTDLILIDEEERVLSPSFRSSMGQNSYQHNLKTLLYMNFMNGCTVLMNAKAREWFAGMPDDARSYDEWLALIAFTFGKAHYIKTPTVLYRRHQSNVSINTDDAGPYSRIKSLIKQIIKVLSAKDDFLNGQIAAVQKFYKFYEADIPQEKKTIFQQFLQLKDKPYIYKKLAYRNMVKQNAVVI